MVQQSPAFTWNTLMDRHLLAGNPQLWNRKDVSSADRWQQMVALSPSMRVVQGGNHFDPQWLVLPKRDGEIMKEIFNVTS